MIKNLHTKNNQYFWCLTFLISSVIALITMLFLVQDAGNSGDESYHKEQAGYVCDYYKSMGEDTMALSLRPPDYNAPYYGQCADNIACAISRTFSVDDEYMVRHAVNSVFGWLMMLFTALIVERICGWRGAVFAFAMIFFSPRLLGHSFNNLKDVPFASMMTMGLYYIFRVLKEFPKIKIRTSIMLALAIGLAIAVRAGGLLLYPYFGLFALLYLFFRNYKKPGLFSKSAVQETGRMVLYGIGISVVGYVIAVLLWPFAMQKPIHNVVFAFKNMSSFAISLRQLFEGTMQWSDYLPWYYTPKYILMTIPIAVIVGLVLFFIFCWRRKEDRIWAFFVFFTFFFPVFWIVYTHANVYGGWRHAMFAYPPMVVAAGWGFEGLVQWLEKRFQVSGSKFQDSWEGRQQDAAKNGKPVLVNVLGTALLLVLLIGPIKHIVANHPYEYVYFNELVGGTKNQLGQYELDYYYHSTREASEWVLANAERKPDGSKVKVATWHAASVQYFFRKDTADFSVGFVRWYEQDYSDWDYAIFTVTGIAPEYLRSKYFPPKNTVKTIEVDGVPIAVVLKREDRNAYYASQVSKDASKLDSAIMLYGRALSYDPNNLCALQGIGESYLRTGRPDSALYYLDRYHAIDPEAETSNYLRAYSYVYKNDAKSSLAILHQLEKQNPKYSASYALAVQLYLQMKDYPSAKKEFDRAIENERMDDQMVRLWLQYNAAQNIDEQHAYISLYKKMAKSYEKKGKKKEAEQYRNLIGLK